MVEAFRALCEEGSRTPSRAEFLLKTKYNSAALKETFGSYLSLMRAAVDHKEATLLEPPIDPNKKAKVLIFDIETAPILAHVWQLWDQNVAVNQIDRDWVVLSWAAKWADEPEVMYQDQRKVLKSQNVPNDKELLKGIWQLLDQADVVVTQNGKKFDQPKLFARFVINGMKPPSSFKHIDTRAIAKRQFAFTSNSLEYMSAKLCVKYKKLKHKKFPGFELWTECLKGNLAAWNEMEKYNKHDVLALEELWNKIRMWDNSVNFNLYTDLDDIHCQCGGEYVRNGYCFTAVGKYQRYRCFDCGVEMRGRENLFGDRKKITLKTRITR